MKNGFKFLHRAALLLLFPVLLAITACGSREGEEEASAISFTKEGTIRSDIRESFDQSYYDRDELQQAVLQEVAGYNAVAGADSITVEKVDVEDGVALVQMTYLRAGDYADFNDVTFFNGSPLEAQSEGFDLNVVLSGVKDTNDTVGKADILAMTDVTLLITDVADAVALQGKALYISDNAVVSGNGKTVQGTEDTKELIYIIYQ